MPKPRRRNKKENNATTTSYGRSVGKCERRRDKKGGRETRLHRCPFDAFSFLPSLYLIGVGYNGSTCPPLLLPRNLGGPLEIPNRVKEKQATEPPSF